MSDPIEINRRNWDERAIIHSRDVTGDYMLDRFRAGEDALHDIEATIESTSNNCGSESDSLSRRKAEAVKMTGATPARADRTRHSVSRPM